MPRLADEFRRSGQAVLDSGGNGTITLNPGGTWQEWLVDYVVVRTSQPAGSIPVPTADIWQNDPSVPANHHGGTRSGDHDTARGHIRLQPTDVVVVTFTGGRPGDTAYAMAYGSYQAQAAFPG